ncbi:MAG: hypothetical protein L6Q54_15640 [Leptospiraceae bacterium]|nr:hypothetical protein [Leptospiraceae bacterium]MCK6382668.1 hypothetical protein [Leptospiraceae bacterium]NUM42915.1 hypothetical protein [Leptospiraceae bacterium]
MKILLEVKDEKALPLINFLRELSFVKTETITESKAEFLCTLKEAVTQVNLAKSGKIKARPAKKLLNEL